MFYTLCVSGWGGGIKIFFAGIRPRLLPPLSPPPPMDQSDQPEIANNCGPTTQSREPFVFCSLVMWTNNKKLLNVVFLPNWRPEKRSTRPKASVNGCSCRGITVLRKVYIFHSILFNETIFAGRFVSSVSLSYCAKNRARENACYEATLLWFSIF